MAGGIRRKCPKCQAEELLLFLGEFFCPGCGFTCYFQGGNYYAKATYL